MVDSVKRCLRKVLGNVRLTYDELSTVLTGVEKTLNSRPLTYLYDEFGEALTPSHLLHGRSPPALSEGLEPEIELDETGDKLSKRFLYLKKTLTFLESFEERVYGRLREFQS